MSPAVSSPSNGIVDEPFPVWLAPMLATAADELPSSAGWLFEPKLDGYRCLAFRDGSAVRLRSRNQQPFDDAYPEIVSAVVEWDVGAVVLDGEVVAFEDGRPSFEALQRIAERRKREEQSTLTYVVFDVLHLHGRSTRSLPLIERRRLLEALPAPPHGITLNPVVPDDGERLLEMMRANGWEGVVAKAADSPYVGRRSTRWQKVKCSLRQEFVVCGFTDPKGARAGFGALLLGYYDGDDLVFAGRVGSGFDRKTLVALDGALRPLECTGPTLDRDAPRERDIHWVPPRLVVDVAYSEWPADGHVRHPRFVGTRPDKRPQEVVRELP